MPKAIDLTGPKTADATLKSATLDGSFGHANDCIDSAALKLINAKENFPLTGDGYESRLDKFVNTIKTFASASGSVGAATGDLVMFIPDVVTGRGNQREEGEAGNFMDEGVAGKALKWTGRIASGTSEVGGAIAGGVLGGVASLPVSATTEHRPQEVIAGGADGGAKFAARTTGHALGFASGLALDVVRLPSVIVKYTLAGAFATVGGIIGFFGGAARAIFNK